MSNYKSEDPFPNAPGLAKMLGIKVREPEGRTERFWGPFKEKWSSVCSNPTHEYNSEKMKACTACQCGHWYNVWWNKISPFKNFGRIVWKVNPDLWIRIANSKFRWIFKA
jgi:hypothetical protein